VLDEEQRPPNHPLFASEETDQPDVQLPTLPERDEVFTDYLTLGLSLKNHPLAFYRSQLDQQHVLPLERLQELKDGCDVKIAGLVILRQRPGTAKGITFVTLEDETGVANLVIHHRVWQRFYGIARRSPAWIVRGRLQRRWSVTHIVVRRLEDLSQTLRRCRLKSRDFR
jgi:error-prone DNA polymerase